MPETEIGKGSIRARGEGAWEVKLDRPRARGVGKRQSVYETVRGSRVDAELRLAAMRKSIEEEEYVEPSKITVAAWLEKWLTDHARGQVSNKTFERYAEIVRNHLIPALGGRRLRRLDASDITAYYNEALRARRRRVRRDGSILMLPPLSAMTMRHVHRVLALALQQAWRLKLIDDNPARRVTAPRPKPTEMNVLDQAQTGVLLRAAEASPIYIVVLLAATTGLRRGEILGLKWRDLDLDKGALSVARTLEQTRDEGLTFKEPKTARSRRRIPLLPFTVEPLRLHRALQGEDRLKAGAVWLDHDLVCCHADGTPLSPRNVTKAFTALVRRLGFNIRLHDLRHTHISQLLAAGVNVKIVSERAGHASIVITLDRYAHLLPGMQDEAVARLDAALRPHLKG